MIVTEVMSRFVHLEFDHESERESGQTGARVRDAAFHLGEAREAYENGQFERALRAYCRVTEFEPGNAGAWAGQVRMLIELGELGEARVWADKALERFPEEAELLAVKAVALARSGSVEEALACSDASILQKGEAAFLWVARGDVLLARKERRADYCFEKALRLAPKDWFVAWLAARARQYYGQFAAAMKLLREALEWDGTRGVVWLGLGQCQEVLGLIGPARVSFAQARQLNAECREASLALVRLDNKGLGARLGGWWRRMRGA